MIRFFVFEYLSEKEKKKERKRNKDTVKYISTTHRNLISLLNSEKNTNIS